MQPHLLPALAATGPGPGRSGPAALWRALPAGVRIALATAAALLASAFRLPVAPGCELYAGMFFALLVYRAAGARAGMLAAAVFMAPSLWWWGHAHSILFAMALILCLPSLERRLGSMTLGVIVFHALVGIPVAFLVVRAQFEATTPTVLLMEARKLTNDGISASLVALLSQRYALDLGTLTISRRRLVSLAALVKGLSGLIVLVAYGSMLIAQALEVQPEAATLKRLMAGAVASDLNRAGWSGALHGGRAAPDPGMEPVAYLAASSPAQLAGGAPALLGCKTTRQRGPDGDRTTVTYWFHSCALAQVQVGRQSAFVAFAGIPFLEAAQWQALRRMGWDASLLAAALLLQLWLSRQISASAAVWQSAFEQFGRPELKMPDVLPFGEIAQPMERFVSAHNNYAATRAKLEDLLNSVRKLQSETDLKLARNVEIDSDGATLRFADLLAPDDPPVILTIHAASRDDLRAIADRAEALVEFRIEGEATEDWHLLVAHDGQGAGRWQSGCVLKLRQAKVLRDSMFHQARLVDLGGMALALSHELKQPLFTISLAAENAEFTLARQGDERLKPVQARLGRIQEQVERARQIIERISAYSRIDSYAHECFDLGDAVRNAARFMRPMMSDQQVTLRIADAVAGPPLVRMPRVGLEQVLVNALHNAVDAIVARRKEEGGEHDGLIEVDITATDSSYVITVADNGTGLRPDLGQSMFDAFVTTKARGKGTGLGLYVARQVVMEVGGRLAIANRPPPARGAVLTVELQAATDAADH